MDFMDTVDPRIERTGRHVHVHPTKYMVRWGVALTLTIAALAVIAVFA